MPFEMTLFSAALMGFIGSIHCVGMCGGIVSALAMGAGNRPRSTILLYVIAYNGGRILSYALAGALAGFLSAQLFQLVPGESGQNAVRWFFAGFTVALGFYLTGWWRGFAVLESMGGKLWATLQPFSKKLFPIDNPIKALCCGVVWGWLPCGMVYAALAWSLTSGSSVAGALMMAAFGFGTLPTLLFVGATARFLKNPTLRHRLAASMGIVLIAGGFYMLISPIFHSVHLHT